jgi:hypothetical protein
MCFSLEWLKQLFILIVIIGGIVALIKLVLPLVVPYLGSWGSIIVRALTIVFHCIIAIIVIIIIFDLISCLLGFGGGGGFLPRLGKG